MKTPKISIAQALKTAILQLKSADIPSPNLDARLLLCNVLDKPKEYLLVNDETKLSSEHLKNYQDNITRRLAREPVCYITGHIEFYGLDYIVDNRVLCPRVETESIVEEVIKSAPKNSQLLDVGIGCGAIGISIKKLREDITVTGSDVSAEALEVAKINAKKLLPSDSIQFILSDLFDDISGTFDVVCANLPYVSNNFFDEMKPEVKKEPAIAIFGGDDDGLRLYRDIYSSLTDRLNPKAQVWHESDPWQHPQLLKMAKQVGLKPIFEDYFVLGFSYQD